MSGSEKKVTPSEKGWLAASFGCALAVPAYALSSVFCDSCSYSYNPDSLIYYPPAFLSTVLSAMASMSGFLSLSLKSKSGDDPDVLKDLKRAAAISALSATLGVGPIIYMDHFHNAASEEQPPSSIVVEAQKVAIRPEELLLSGYG